MKDLADSLMVFNRIDQVIYFKNNYSVNQNDGNGKKNHFSLEIY